MTYFTFAVLIGYFFYQNATTVLARLRDGNATATTWILFVVTVLFIPLFVVLVIRGIRDVREQRKKKEELQRELAARQAQQRREWYLDDFSDTSNADIAQAADDAHEPDPDIVLPSATDTGTSDNVLSDYDC